MILATDRWSRNSLLLGTKPKPEVYFRWSFLQSLSVSYLSFLSFPFPSLLLSSSLSLPNFEVSLKIQLMDLSARFIPTWENDILQAPDMFFGF